ncbi:MAG: ABC transporter permease, partial [Oscillospiraceae bacterium]|nr:ABC transporter permease [Oscillospiraceae bacterium]
MEKANVMGAKILPVLKSRYTLLAGIIAAEFILFGFAAPYFLTVGNLFNILRQVSEIGMISIPLTFLLLSGHMDLSVGSIVGVCGVTTGMILRAGGPIVLAMLAGIAAGAAIGFINGLIVGKLKIQAVVVTIGTQVMFRGLCYILTSGRAVSGYPLSFFTLGTGDVLGVPISVIVLLLMYAGAWFVLEKSWFG